MGVVVSGFAAATVIVAVVGEQQWCQHSKDNGNRAQLASGI